MTYPIQHIGNTILLVMMDVEEGHEAEFDRWYNEEHLPERMEIPGYVSARRFKLEEGNGVLKYLCIWEMEDASPLQSEKYKNRSGRARAGFARRPTSTSRSEPGACTSRSTRWKAPSRTVRFLPQACGHQTKSAIGEEGDMNTQSRANVKGAGITCMALALSVACAAGAHAQENFPNRPVRLVNPYTPGGSVDLVSRGVAVGPV